jgi:hypothetical protein
MKNDDVAALWQAQHSDGFRMSSEELRLRIETLNRKMRRRTINGYLVCGALIVFFIGKIIAGTNSLETVGSLLIIVGSGYLAWQIRQIGFRNINSGDATNTTEHLMRELARQRDFHRGSRLWSRLFIFIPGPLVFSAGFAQAHPEALLIIRLEMITFGVLVVAAAIPLNLWMAHRYQKQIDALTRLQEEE